MRLYVQAPDGGEFLIDTSSMKEIPPLDADWRDQAAVRIEQLRMDDLTVR